MNLCKVIGHRWETVVIMVGCTCCPWENPPPFVRVLPAPGATDHESHRANWTDEWSAMTYPWWTVFGKALLRCRWCRKRHTQFVSQRHYEPDPWIDGGIVGDYEKPGDYARVI